MIPVKSLREHYQQQAIEDYGALLACAARAFQKNEQKEVHACLLSLANAQRPL